jgi:hypothetical protein
MSLSSLSKKKARNEPIVPGLESAATRERYVWLVDSPIRVWPMCGQQHAHRGAFELSIIPLLDTALVRQGSNGQDLAGVSGREHPRLQPGHPSPREHRRRPDPRTPYPAPRTSHPRTQNLAPQNPEPIYRIIGPAVAPNVSAVAGADVPPAHDAPNSGVVDGLFLYREMNAPSFASSARSTRS